MCGKEIFKFGCGDGETDLSGEAFGCPPKTIRAMLAGFVTTVTFICFVGSMIVFAIDEQYKLLLGVLTATTNITSVAIGYYFGHRSATHKEKSEKKDKFYSSPNPHDSNGESIMLMESTEPTFAESEEEQ